MSSYASALTGLLANETALSVVGDNLANMNTQGYKSENVLFEDAMNAANANLQIGSGVSSTLTSTSFTQGAIQTTGGTLDAAIQGNGFFVVQNPQGGTAYTRDGSFSIDSSGNLVTSAGDTVQGWTAVGGVLNASGPTSAITIPPLTSIQPTATANMTMSINLDATAATGATFSQPIQVVDSLGNTQTLSINYTETAPNSWSYEVTIPGEDVSGGTAGTPASLATGTLTFDTNGQLKTPAPGTPITVKTAAAMADGADALNINWNLYDSNNNSLVTQFAETSASSGTTQDGVQPGTATGVTLQNGGELVASYSNGKQVTIAQVAVAAVANPDSMIAISGNKYVLGTDTLTPSVGASGTGPRGNIVGGSIEGSNVDMATQFTNLIVYQRGYEASSKVITTQNQMDQTLLAITL